ncbi:hypothetical protein C8Q69DRAFT_529482 [Paecilomyces variotii]|uniref:Uncharacterized protein n=1 Tax=Byssochlamys spectabilis TaxID=264951 RepID=A0A443HP47_BYSSP|nr:hypothetical protein C8Q69DRAFT_529482 [Paecilomyces variotii]RWQ93595.1 hypothetical protein C8Q69DRAFT_529482 [Paecilomyces variotii]
MAISRDAFKKVMEAAVSVREHVYDNFYASHWRWEDDNTNADRDASSFADLAHLLGFSAPETYSNSLTPAFEVHARIIDILKRAVSDIGKSVIMIHYAGHGGLNYVL